ncbi:MAG TPA: DinB family protein [Gemmatimonadaceae bacterium]|nr:DinB family protein [Gemmatimonadaceae bacterium]
MRLRSLAMIIALASVPSLAAAQTASVSEAFRDQATRASKNLLDAANEMPADKYGFKPTPAQMSFGDIVAHLVEGNDYLCGAITGAKAPTRAKVTGASSKDALVAELKDSFAFCNESLAKLDDSKLDEQIPFFGGKPRSRANILFVTVGDWADHYSQSAIYLRLNGLLPPTAKKAN